MNGVAKMSAIIIIAVITVIVAAAYLIWSSGTGVGVRTGPPYTGPPHASCRIHLPPNALNPTIVGTIVGEIAEATQCPAIGSKLLTNTSAYEFTAFSPLMNNSAHVTAFNRTFIMGNSTLNITVHSSHINSNNWTDAWANITLDSPQANATPTCGVPIVTQLGRNASGNSTSYAGNMIRCGSFGVQFRGYYTVTTLNNSVFVANLYVSYYPSVPMLIVPTALNNETLTYTSNDGTVSIPRFNYTYTINATDTSRLEQLATCKDSSGYQGLAFFNLSLTPVPNVNCAAVIGPSFG